MQRGYVSTAFPTGKRYDLQLAQSAGQAFGTFKAKACASIRKNDVVQMYAGGLCGAVGVTDYAAIGTVGAAILGSTTTTYYAARRHYQGSLALQGPDGFLYILTTNNTASFSGVRLSKYTAAGVLVVSVDTTIATCDNCNIFFLSNGNVCVISNGYFAIFNPVGLTTVVAATQIDATYYANNASIPLAGGGFAVFYLTGTGLTATLAILDNTGTPVANNTSFVTVTFSPPTSGISNLSVQQLSSGNLAVAYFGSAGAWRIGRYDLTATLQGSTINTGLSIGGASSGGAAAPYIVPIAGFFAFAVNSAAGQVSMMVFSDAGTQQGTTQTYTGVSLLQPAYMASLCTDGSSFWLVYLAASTMFFVQFSTTGAVLSNFGFAKTSTSTSAMWTYFDPSTGNFVSLCDSTVYAVFTPSQGTMPVSFATFTTGWSTNGYSGGQTQTCQGLLMLGDASFIAYGGDANPKAFISIWKSVNSAILGVAQKAVGAGGYVSITVASGVYYCNTLKGTQSKTFDFSVASVYGNKGAVLTNGIALKGM